MKKPWHIGIIVRSTRHDRVEELLRQYTQRVQQHYMAYRPPPDRPGY